MSIVAAVRKERVKKLQKQLRGADVLRKAVQQQATIAADVLSGDSETTYPDEHKAQRLYYEYLGAYQRRARGITTITSKRSLALWRGVVACAKEAERPIEEYISAQFQWFDKNFGTYPKSYQLRTKAAVQRALEGSNNPRKVVSKYKASTNSTADVMRMADKQVRDMCRAQKVTREEFYMKFVLTGLVQLPEPFLKADPAYRKAVGK